MTAEEGRAACGVFGCIRGKEEKCRYPIKMYGTVVVTDSYNLLFNNTSDELDIFPVAIYRKFLCYGRKEKSY